MLPPTARLMHYQIPAAQCLLSRLSAAPVTRVPDAARFAVKDDANTIAAARLALVSQRHRERPITVNGDRRQRIGDVLNVGFAVEYRSRIRMWGGSGDRCVYCQRC